MTDSKCPMCGQPSKYQIPDPSGIPGKKYCKACGCKFMGR